MGLFRRKSYTRLEAEVEQLAGLVKPHLPTMIVFQSVGGGHALFSGLRGGQSVKSYQQAPKDRVLELADKLLILVADQGVADWPLPGVVKAHVVATEDELLLSYMNEQGSALQLGKIVVAAD
jgi:hypothetical protein